MVQALSGWQYGVLRTRVLPVWKRTGSIICFGAGGIEPSRVEGNVEYVDNYQQLAELIRRDKNVLGFGLRGVPFHGLRILAVNGMSPTVPDGYPFSTLISLATRRSGKGCSLMTKNLRQARQRFEQDRRNLSNFRASTL